MVLLQQELCGWKHMQWSCNGFLLKFTRPQIFTYDSSKRLRRAISKSTYCVLKNDCYEKLVRFQEKYHWTIENLKSGNNVIRGNRFEIREMLNRELLSKGAISVAKYLDCQFLSQFFLVGKDMVEIIQWSIWKNWRKWSPMHTSR